MSRYLYKKIQNISPESLNFQHSGLKLTTLGSDPNVVESKNVQKNCLKETIYYSSEKIRRIPELRQNAGLTTPLLAGLVHTKLYLPATGAGVPYTSGFNTASGVASIVAADEGDEESRVLYNNGDGTWIDENGNLYEK